MGKLSRDRGLPRERGVVELHRANGVHAERVPLSGAARYRGNDVPMHVWLEIAQRCAPRSGGPA